jgi:hypothetical protein
MKHLRSSRASFLTKKYSGARYVERSGIGTRLLSQEEIERLQAGVEQARQGQPQPIRLEVPA